MIGQLSMVTGAEPYIYGSTKMVSQITTLRDLDRLAKATHSLRWCRDSHDSRLFPDALKKSFKLL